MSIRSARFRNMATRSGRFASADATTPIVIILGRTGAFYRVLNSGENPFRINDGSGATTLDPAHSLDISVTGSVSIVTVDVEQIEGIYDYLNTDRPRRSGRFKVTPAAGQAHKIIDLSGGGGNRPKAFYRIFNSGEAPFNVRRGTTTIKQLQPDDSFDFEIATGMGASRDVYVAPLANGVQIEGIYDFLGQE